MPPPAFESTLLGRMECIATFAKNVVPGLPKAIFIILLSQDDDVDSKYGGTPVFVYARYISGSYAQRLLEVIVV